MSVKREPITGIRQPIIFDKQNECPYEKPFGYIYMITNNVNGHMYIGKHVYHKPRIDTSYRGSGTKLDLAYKKYGFENFSVKILEWCKGGHKILCEREVFWIDLFDTFNQQQHYNLTPGGDGGEISKESRKKLSESTNRYYRNHPEAIEDYAQKMKNLWSTNRDLFPQTRKGKDSPFYNKSHVGRVLCIENNKEFDNAVRAGEWLVEQGYAKTRYISYHVSACCRGAEKRCCGFTWKII